jgi:hypothetical protein
MINESSSNLHMAKMYSRWNDHSKRKQSSNIRHGTHLEMKFLIHFGY